MNANKVKEVLAKNVLADGFEPIIDLDKSWIFSEKHIQSKSKNTPLLGKKLTSKIEYTINKGFISNHLD